MPIPKLHLYQDYPECGNYFLPSDMYVAEWLMVFNFIRKYGVSPHIVYDRPWRKEWRRLIPKRARVKGSHAR